MSSKKGSCVVTLILMVSLLWIAESRYLPTRSDPSRYEHIKEVLRALLDLNEEGSNARTSYIYDDVYRSKRSPFHPNTLPSSLVHTQ
ncbi:uncharacterized protein [Parasteatoda tepidariorum]|uniref:uncharacterized protein n=1 Tax=Parasteatoda tepidariorum TaxID=114398 RepID=UPI001C726B8D|nr:uncharacterized protein LOC122269834 [Parasteatoda tepidariorum]